MRQIHIDLPWDRQPLDGDTPALRASSVFTGGHVWLPQDLSGRSLQGLLAAPPSGTVRTPSSRSAIAISNTGTAGAAVEMPDVASFKPIALFGYGYFLNDGGAWIFQQVNRGASGNTATITLDSSTAIRLLLQFGFGTTRIITVTLPTVIGVPLCAIAGVYSATDYYIACNGILTEGTLSPGTFSNMDQVWNNGGTLNGGLWASGHGFGDVVDRQHARWITEDPENRLWDYLFDPQRFSVPVNASPPSYPVLSAATVANITATTATPRVTITI